MQLQNHCYHSSCYIAYVTKNDSLKECLLSGHPWMMTQHLQQQVLVAVWRF